MAAAAGPQINIPRTHGKQRRDVKMLTNLPGDVLDAILQKFESMYDAQCLAEVLMLFHSSVSSNEDVETLKSAYKRLPQWPSVNMLFDDTYNFRDHKVYAVFKMFRRENRLTIALSAVETLIPKPHTTTLFRMGQRKLNVACTFTVCDMDLSCGHFNRSEYEFYAFTSSRQMAYGDAMACVIRKEVNGTGRLSVFTFPSQWEMQYWVKHVKRGKDVPPRNHTLAYQIAVPETAARFICAHILSKFDTLWQKKRYESIWGARR